jgi:hypothetical protein
MTRSDHSAEGTSGPLLSICIPTYNRSQFLKVMLQALLPQVKDCGRDVEVWVLDNGSTDDTANVLQESSRYGPFRSLRHPENVGPTRNIICGPVDCATGLFSWVLGDHNLLMPGSLNRVLQVLRDHQSLDAAYVNFRAATYPEHWPIEAEGGYSGQFCYVGNNAVTSGLVSQWADLIQCESALCTACYAHIVKTKIWRSHWENRLIGKDYSSVETTYPHTVMLIHQCLRRPAIVIAEPCITIFNGAQSWGTVDLRARVCLIGLAELIGLLRKFKIDEQRCRILTTNFFLPHAKAVTIQVMQQLRCPAMLCTIFAAAGFRAISWKAVTQAIPEGLFSKTVRRTQRLHSLLFDRTSGYLWNFRPARWLRNIRRSV